VLDGLPDALPGVLHVFSEGDTVPERKAGVALSLKGALGKAFVDFEFPEIGGATAAFCNRRERAIRVLGRGFHAVGELVFEGGGVKR
jgi:hypothetical protein